MKNEHFRGGNLRRVRNHEPGETNMEEWQAQNKSYIIVPLRIVPICEICVFSFFLHLSHHGLLHPHGTLPLVVC